MSFGKFLWCLPAESLMGSEVIVVDDILEEFVGEVSRFQKLALSTTSSSNVRQKRSTFPLICGREGLV